MYKPICTGQSASVTGCGRTKKKMEKNEKQTRLQPQQVSVHQEHVTKRFYMKLDIDFRRKIVLRL